MRNDLFFLCMAVQSHKELNLHISFRFANATSFIIIVHITVIISRAWYENIMRIEWKLKDNVACVAGGIVGARNNV